MVTTKEQQKEWVLKHPSYWRDRYWQNPEESRRKAREIYKKWIAKRPNYHKERYWSNPEKARERSRKSHRDKNVRKEYDSQCYLKNKEKILKRNKTYFRSHPEFLQISRAKRRARLLKIPGSFTAKELLELKIKSKGICLGYKQYPHYAGIKKLTIDHVEPLTLPNGKVNPKCTNYIYNIQLLCKPCNSRKYNHIAPAMAKSGDSGAR